MTDLWKDKRSRDARARRRAADARAAALERRVRDAIRDGRKLEEIATSLGVSRSCVWSISSRLQAEGEVPASQSAAREVGEVYPERDDALAQAALRHFGVFYRNVVEETRHNVVTAYRNGLAARTPVFGGSIAGACADTGSVA